MDYDLCDFCRMPTRPKRMCSSGCPSTFPPADQALRIEKFQAGYRRGSLGEVARKTDDDTTELGIYLGHRDREDQMFKTIRERQKALTAGQRLMFGHKT